MMNKQIREKIFKQDQKTLKSELDTFLRCCKGRTTVNEDGYLYSRGKHPVLLVAHLDTVHKETPKTILYSDDENVVMSLEGIGGDDRCGVIIILEILEKLDCSVVFLEDEEIGCVGAKKFCDSKIDIGNINYAVEFDRKGGNDYVFYKDYNKDFEEHIKKFGFVKATGSCSDISSIAPAFKIEAVNISCGYYSPHCWYEYVRVDEMCDIIDRATKMIAAKTDKFAYVEPTVVKYTAPKTTNYYQSYCFDDYYNTPTYYSWNSYKSKKQNPIWLTDKQVILIVGNKQKKFDKIYMDCENNIYWDENLSKPIEKGYVIGIKYHYTCTYWSASRDYPKQVYSLRTADSPVFVESSQALLIVNGVQRAFKRVFVDSDNNIYEDVWLKNKIDKAELLLADDMLDLSYADICVMFPDQKYNLNKKRIEK